MASGIQSPTSMCSANWLPATGLTAAGRPVLLPGEVERHLVASVDLEADENPSLAPFPGGLLVLTSHRLIWVSDPPSPSAAARALPLAAVVHAFPPRKSLRKMFASPRLRLQVSLPASSAGEGGSARPEVLTVVMRGKTDPDVFYGRLVEVLRSRAWESAAEETPEAAAAKAEAAERMRMPVVGVSGILRKEQEMWESTDRSLQEAFQDLNALMGKAKEMVQLAERMRMKLLSSSSTQANSNDEEMGSKQDMQDWLLSVGIVSPVTKESAGALYHQQLSRQLADFVKLPLEKAGGMMAVVDVYCLFNRARGTELISPEDLLQACALWEKFDVPVMLRKFDSGVKVIQNKSRSDNEVFARISSLATKPDALRKGISPSDAAFTLGIAPALAKEHLLAAESIGLLCRDVSADGFRFYVNLFKEIESNNIYSLKPNGLFYAWVSATAVSG